MTAIKLQELNEFNQEIIALARAKMPLEPSLVQLGLMGESRLNELGRRIALHLSNGVPLPEALERETANISPVYAAVVEAGLASGRLPDALASVSTTWERMTEVRRLAWQSLLYPAAIIVLTYFVFAFVVSTCVPRLLAMRRDLKVPVATIDVLLESTSLFLTTWYWAIPAVFLLALMVGVLREWMPLRFSGWFSIPSLGLGVRTLLTRASFLETLATLLEHQIPLPRALNLSARTTSDRLLKQSATRLAEEVNLGATTGSLSNVKGLPKILGWILTTGLWKPDAVTLCRRTAEAFQRQAERRAQLIQVAAVPIFVALMAGGTVATYALAVGYPLFVLLSDLAAEGSRY